MTDTTTTTTTPSSAVDPNIYGKTGNMDKHLEGIQKQYDTDEKRQFYAQVMGDGTSNIHFGKWDGIDVEQEGAYGKAAEQQTDFMFQLVMGLLNKDDDKPAETTEYIDLGSGSGAAAIRLLGLHPNLKATCLNLCPEQNNQAQTDAKSANVDERITVITGTYDDPPKEYANKFDFCFSQDAFVHAFDKVATYKQALKITKPGGAFVFCDLMCGTGENVEESELQTFAQTNMVSDWLSPIQNVKACEEAGWTNVTFVDQTQDIKLSFQLMGKKVDKLIEQGGADLDPTLLSTYQTNLKKRVEQVDRGVFQWGTIHAIKAAAAE